MMLGRLLILLVVVLGLSACSYPSFNVPAKEYRSKVQTLGVLPLLVDAGSDIHHSKRDRVIELLNRKNQEAVQRLVEMLRAQKGYFDVRLLSGDPRFLYDELVAGSNVSGEGAQLHFDYAFHGDAAARLMEASQVDGLLVLVMHGVVRSERRWDRAALSVTYLDTPLNVVTVAGYVLDPSGNPMWTFSNKRAGAFLDLQYPDFDEAHYNRSEHVAMKYLRLEGVERALEVKSEQALPSETLSEPYWSLFRKVVADLDPERQGLFR